MSRPGTPEFQIELAEAMKSQRPLPSGRSFKVLIASYRANRKWAKLAPRTQKDYTNVATIRKCHPFWQFRNVAGRHRAGSRAGRRPPPSQP